MENKSEMRKMSEGEIDLSDGLKFKMDFSESFKDKENITVTDFSEFLKNEYLKRKGTYMESIFYALSEYHIEEATKKPDLKAELIVPVTLGECGGCGCHPTKMCAPICVYITCWCGRCEW